MVWFLDVVLVTLMAHSSISRVMFFLNSKMLDLAEGDFRSLKSVLGVHVSADKVHTHR